MKHWKYWEILTNIEYFEKHWKNWEKLKTLKILRNIENIEKYWATLRNIEQHWEILSNIETLKTLSSFSIYWISNIEFDSMSMWKIKTLKSTQCRCQCQFFQCFNVKLNVQCRFADPYRVQEIREIAKCLLNVNYY